MRIEVLRKSGNWTEARLVDVLPRTQQPDPASVYRYFGLDAPAAAFLAHGTGRLVFKIIDESYFVVPNNAHGMQYWRFADETATDR